MSPAATVTARLLAGEMYEAMEQATRDDGTRFWRRKDGAEEWMREACLAAHGETLPDDWRYEFIVEALSTWTDLDDDADDDAMREAIDQIEADIYTAALTRWLSSDLRRPGYCDEAVEEYGQPEGGLIAVIQLGQWREKQETANLLLDFLIEFAEEHEEVEA